MHPALPSASSICSTLISSHNFYHRLLGFSSSSSSASLLSSSLLSSFQLFSPPLLRFIIKPNSLEPLHLLHNTASPPPTTFSSFSVSTFYFSTFSSTFAFSTFFSLTPAELSIMLADPSVESAQCPPPPPTFRVHNHLKLIKKHKTSQELRMLSSVTINCQETMIVMNPGSQLSVL